MPIRILVVDDAAFIRDMMKKHLRERIPGAELFDAGDGNRAIAVLRNNNIDLVLSDWEMPNLSGEELLRWIRSEDKYKALPFVMVSSRGDRDHVIKAIEAGVSDYLSKPFTPEELIKKVAKQLKKVGIDIEVKFGGAAMGNQGHAFGSIEALTGGKAENTLVSKPKAAAKKGLVAAPAIPAKTSKTSANGATTKAQLRFASGICDCDVKDLSLQALNGVIKRDDKLPAMFEPAVVDISGGDGGSIARLNAYVHSLQAGENSLNADAVKIVVRFVDDDPQKFEVLSKHIANRRA